MDTNAVELGWTALAIVGFAVQAVLIWDAWQDLRTVYAYTSFNGAKRIVVWSHLRIGAALLGCHTFFITLGVRAMFLTDPPPSPGRYMSVALLIAASILLVLIGVDEHVVRRKLRQHGKENP